MVVPLSTARQLFAEVVCLRADLVAGRASARLGAPLGVSVHQSSSVSERQGLVLLRSLLEQRHQPSGYARLELTIDRVLARAVVLVVHGGRGWSAIEGGGRFGPGARR